MKRILLIIAVIVFSVCTMSAAQDNREEAPAVSDEVISAHIIMPRSAQPTYLSGGKMDVEVTQTADAALEIPEKKPRVIETREPTPSPVPKLATTHDIELIARTIWGEAEGVKSRAEQAAVAWCILNRVDSYGDSIESTILAPYQFYCRTWDAAVPSYFTELAEDVVHRWEQEHAGYTDVGRTLPAGYLFFNGDGERNHFTVEWKGTNCWDWSLPDPYIN